MTARIGFIGIGLMGGGMAANLRKAGFPVTVCDLRAENVARLVELGAASAPTPRQVADASDFVFLSVGETREVETIIYGRDGLLDGLRPGMILVDTSTSDPASTLRINADMEARGAAMADAPLVHTPIEVEAGTSTTMVGATAETFAAIRPALETYCAAVFHMGPVGAGHRTKLIFNSFSLGINALVADAFCACLASGIDLRKFSDVVSESGSNSLLFQKIARAVEGDFAGVSHRLEHGEKDTRYFTQMTRDLGLTGLLGPVVHQMYLQALKLGFDDAFIPSLIEAQARLNGLEAPPRKDA